MAIYIICLTIREKRLFFLFIMLKVRHYFLGHFWHILLFIVCNFKDVTVIRNYND